MIFATSSICRSLTTTRASTSRRASSSAARPTMRAVLLLLASASALKPATTLDRRQLGSAVVGAAGAALLPQTASAKGRATQPANYLRYNPRIEKLGAYIVGDAVSELQSANWAKLVDDTAAELGKKGGKIGVFCNGELAADLWANTYSDVKERQDQGDEGRGRQDDRRARDARGRRLPRHGHVPQEGGRPLRLRRQGGAAAVEPAARQRGRRRPRRREGGLQHVRRAQQPEPPLRPQPDEDDLGLVARKDER